MGNNILRVSRPYYSNARIFESLRRRADRRTCPPKIHFLFGVTYSPQKAAQTTKLLRDVDSVYFANPHSVQAHEHLELILEARGGGAQARRVLQERQEADLARFAQFDSGQLDLGEDAKYLTPSTASGEHHPDLVGDKGFNLLDLALLGYPVPAFCIINTNVRELGYGERHRLIDKAVETLERLTGKKYNDPKNPLLFSIRGGLHQNAPGILPTYLNIGAAAQTLPALIEIYGEATAYDIRIQHVLALLLDYDPALYREAVSRPSADKRAFLAELEAIMAKTTFVTFSNPQSHPAHFIERIIRFYRDNEAVLRSATDGRCEYPAVVLQEMVVGRGEDSFSAVFRSREEQAAANSKLVVAFGAFGEELMTGAAKPREIIVSGQRPIERISAGVDALYAYLIALEARTKGPVTAELTQDRGMLAILQLSRTSLHGPEMLKVAVELFANGTIGRGDLLNLVRPHHLRQTFADSVRIPSDWQPLATGVSILPRGRVCARVYFSEEAALEAKARGEKAILIKEQFSPADVPAMMEVDGLVSISPAAIHVSEVARRYGVVSLVGIDEPEKVRTLAEGDFVVISSRKKALYRGQAEVVPSRLSLSLIGAIPESDLTAEDRELQRRYSVYKDAISRLTLAEIYNVEALADLTDILTFMDNQERAADLINGWFDLHQREFVQYFLETCMGKHRSRINLFKLLTSENKVKLIKVLLSQQIGLKDRGMFIIGRLLLLCEEEIGQERYASFLDNFSREDKSKLAEERRKAEEYLKISRVPPTIQADKAPAQAGGSDDFMEALRRRIGDRADILSADQIAQLRRTWDLDPDPLHKPHKVISRALAEAKIT